jgi:anti-sigma B factor antagonist
MAEREIDFELLRLKTRRDGGTHKVSAHGELDMLSSQALERELRAARESDADHIVLDLSGLTFLDLSGLRVILSMDARSRERPGRFLVRRGPPNVHRVLEVTSAARQLSFVG